MFLTELRSNHQNLRTSGECADQGWRNDETTYHWNDEVDFLPAHYDNRSILRLPQIRDELTLVDPGRKEAESILEKMRQVPHVILTSGQRGQ